MIDRLIDGRGIGGYQLVILGLAALGFVLEGLAVQALGLALPDMMADWHLPRTAFASATALGLVGFAIGAGVGGRASDIVGRRTLMLISIVIFGAGTGLSALSHNPAELSLWRIVAGLGLGAVIPATSALMIEFSPTRQRGLVLSIGLMFLPLGGFAAGLLSAYILPHSGWRTLFVVIAAISLVGDLAILAFLPESPRFLARKPHCGAAVVKILRRIGIELSEETIATEPAAMHAAPLTALFAKDIRIETLCLWLAFFFVVMSLYAVFAWTPSVLHQQGFTLAGSSEALSAFAAGGIFAGPVSGWLSERIGARKTFFIVSVGAFVATISLALCIATHVQQFALYLIGLILLGGALSGAQTVLFILGARVYEVELRSTGLGAAISVGRVGAVLSPYIVLVTLRAGGAAYYLSIGVAMGLALAATLRIKLRLTTPVAHPAAHPVTD